MKKKNNTLKTWLFVVLLLLFHNKVLGFNSEFHGLITEEAINRSNQLYNNGDDYLKNQLGFPDGLNTTFAGYSKTPYLGITYTTTQSAREWLTWGSIIEDSPFTITITHFYDPVNERGLTDLPWWIPQHPDHALSRARDGVGFDYSWSDARNSYELALTTGTEQGRNANFAKTFRALGQIIHLLEDMGVPAHVRNDNHFPIIWGSDLYEKYWNPIVGLPTISNYPVTLNKFEYYWDDNSGKGLAEFTNHNFLSRDTVFRPETDSLHYYANPSESDCELYEKIDEDSCRRRYWKYTAAKDEYTDNNFVVERLVAASYLGINSDGSPNYEVGDLVKNPDNFYCHKEYGQHIIPIVVGYSAGLLDYFFRGQLGLEVRASTSPGYYTVAITNNSTETMNGKFRLFWDNATGGRTEIISGMLPLIRTLVPDETVSLEIPESALPPDFSEIAAFTGVFRGILGEEEGAVVGKVSPAVVLAWFEGWENAEVRSYAVYDKIYGDSGQWDTVAWSGGEPVTLEVDSSKKLLTGAQLRLWRWQMPGSPVISVKKSSSLNIPVTKPNTMFRGDNYSNFDLGGAWFEPTEGGPSCWAENFFKRCKESEWRIKGS